MSARQLWEAIPCQDGAVAAGHTHPGIALFWKPGAGKTVTALTLADEWLTTGRYGTKVLVVAPKRVALDTWGREALKWAHTAHLRLSLVVGAPGARMDALRADADVYVVNVENLAWLVDLYKGRRIQHWPFRCLVVDELSGYKDHMSLRSRRVRRLGRAGVVDKVVGLTGSPASNGYDYLFSMMLLIDGGERLGKTETQFRDLFMEPNKRSKDGKQVWTWRPRAGKAAEIQALIADVCLVVPDSYAPPIEHIPIDVVLAAEEKAHIKQLKKHKLLSFDAGDVTAVNGGVLLNKLLQVTSGAVYNEHNEVQWLHDAKLWTLGKLVANATGPVLLFYAYKHELERIRKVYPWARELDTAADIADWNAGRIPLAVMHPASTYGLNLQDGGHTIIWWTLPWSLEYFEQANGRLARRGQPHTVRAYMLMVPGSVDWMVWNALQAKDDSQDALLDGLLALQQGTGLL